MNNAKLTALIAAAALSSLSLGLPLGSSFALGAAPPNDPPGAASARSELEGLGWRAASERFGGVQADTRPSRDSTMKFSVPTEVREVLVTGGQRVRKGDLLVRARDADILAVVEMAKLRASNDLEVRGSEASLELAQFRFDQAREAYTKSGLSELEYQEARIHLQTTGIQLDIAKKRLEEAQLSVLQYEGQAERFRLEAPFDGVVEEVMVELGQGVSEQQPAIRVVNTELLWLDAYPATDETIRLSLQEGSPAWVLLDLAGRARLVPGRVLYVSPVADSVSQKRRVRVEVANPEGWPAGTQARVRFTEPSPEWLALLEEPAPITGDEDGTQGEGAATAVSGRLHAREGQ